MENSTKSSTASSDDANNAKKELSFSGKSAIGTMVQGITDLATATTIKTDDTTDNTGTTFGNEDKKFRFLYKLKTCF
uniref:Uncharacterized protein n=1 Tax=Onchocerca volvulus TaxID=6282 RepID=A0A8R1TPY2_ONCVO